MAVHEIRLELLVAGQADRLIERGIAIHVARLAGEGRAVGLLLMSR